MVQVSLSQNLAPTSGRVSILPDRGNALDTVFQLSAEQWVDPKVPVEDYPLSYTFGYFDMSGFPKLFSSTSLLPSFRTMLPPGTDAVNCKAVETRCRRLRLYLAVSDALFALSEAAVPTYVRIDNMDPLKMRQAIQKELNVIQTMEDNMQGEEVLSKCTTIAESMNDETVNFQFYGVSIEVKIGFRDRLITHVDYAMRAILSPLKVPSLIHGLSTLSAILGADLELSESSVALASAMLQDFSKILLLSSRAGLKIPGMSTILRITRTSLGQLSQASSRLSSRSPSRRQAKPGENGMDVIRSVNGLSKLSLSGHVPGQQSVIHETPKFILKNDRVELEDMGGWEDNITGVAISSCADCVKITPTLAYIIPNNPVQRRLSELKALAFEVESAIIYNQILPESRTELTCIDTGNQVLWSSQPVLIPGLNPDEFGTVDISGNTVSQEIRTGVTRMAFVNCPLLSFVHLLVFREIHTDVDVLQADKTEAITITMAFDPTVRAEITKGATDPFTGIGSSASCVRWDADLRVWTAKGIQHVDVNMGSSNGQGAYATCKTKQTGTFAVSEVNFKFSMHPELELQYESESQVVLVFSMY